MFTRSFRSHCAEWIGEKILSKLLLGSGRVMFLYLSYSKNFFKVFEFGPSRKLAAMFHVFLLRVTRL